VECRAQVELDVDHLEVVPHVTSEERIKVADDGGGEVV
jgi:hypothetical protein